jgi:hypothetical protein
MYKQRIFLNSRSNIVAWDLDTNKVEVICSFDSCDRGVCCIRKFWGVDSSLNLAFVMNNNGFVVVTKVN